MSGMGKLLPVIGTAVGAYFGGPIGAEALGGVMGASAGTAVGSGVGAALGGAAGTALAPKPGMPSVPTVSAPTTMPTPGDASAMAARRASIADNLRRRGRASTILTDPLSGSVSNISDALGG